MKGRWLDLAAGDGRYVKELLGKVDSLIVSDVDKIALKTLKNSIRNSMKNKVQSKTFDVRKKFTFPDNAFDGVFCTGSLHLFSEKQIMKIFAEIDRILKPKGSIIFDFATDITRKKKGVNVREKHAYSVAEAEKILKSLMSNYEVKVYKSSFKDDMSQSKYGWIVTGNFVLAVGRKLN